MCHLLGELIVVCWVFSLISLLFTPADTRKVNMHFRMYIYAPIYATLLTGLMISHVVFPAVFFFFFEFELDDNCSSPTMQYKDAEICRLHFRNLLV